MEYLLLEVCKAPQSHIDNTKLMVVPYLIQFSPALSASGNGTTVYPRVQAKTPPLPRPPQPLNPSYCPGYATPPNWTFLVPSRPSLICFPHSSQSDLLNHKCTLSPKHTHYLKSFSTSPLAVSIKAKTLPRSCMV